MSAPEASTPPKPKGKKLIIIIAAVLLVVAGGAGWFMFGRHAAEEGDEAPVAHSSKPKAPPVFLPVDNMVVNLADPGGDRYAQIGVTIEVVDLKTSDQVKAYMPSVRSAILMLVSQRTSEELLSKDGKAKLSRDILREISHPLGYTVEDDEDDHADDKPKAKSQRRAKAGPPNPINNVLFTSFIVQ
ncbi:flagellar basal body-associated FliL family protein [Variovorax sp. HJSM1_2]|uniref:flagellar basal body-associated FliL family protein n=1 Tax=Variovorax sp. HJSM1_2 TaxID=3366263 RepID=UPI003BDF059A